MKILVTGGAGAIGSYLTRFLEAQGHQVIIVDDMSSGFDFNISEKASFYKVDISSKEDVAAVFKEHDFDVIYHLAAFFANQNSVDHPVRDLEVNGIGTLNILDQALKQYKEGKLKHFLFASSSCVYGMCSGAINETQVFSPETPYAITKILGERYIDFYSEHYGLPVTTFRFFNSYGPGELPGKYRNVIPNFIKRALNDEPLVITGTGEETRDFTYIEDTCRALALCVTNEKVFGEKLNVATSRETTIIDIATQIIKLSGSKSEIQFVPRRSWDHTTKRLGDINRLNELTGYKPTFTLAEGLEKTIAWHKEVKKKGLENYN